MSVTVTLPTWLLGAFAGVLVTLAFLLAVAHFSSGDEAPEADDL